MSNGTETNHVDHLISGLSAGGAVESVGGFTLDRDKAREKMRQFQLAEPHRYVLELVQAAVLKGASRIDFHIDADDMRMTFDGRPFTREDVDALYSSLFARMRNPENDARQHLAVGLNAAMALNPRYVRVDSGSGEARLRLELRSDKEDRIEAREVDADAPTVIHVKARFRPGLVVGFFRDLQGTIPEEKLLRTHCARARTEIYLDDEPVNHGYDLPGAVAVQKLKGEGVHGLVGFDPTRSTGAAIEWIKHGVWITTHDFDIHRDSAWVQALGLDLYPGLDAVVEADALRMDFSRQGIVWDDAYRDVLIVLRQARDEAVKQICHWSFHNIPAQWAKGMLWKAMAKLPMEELLSDDPDSVGFHMAGAPLWTLISGDELSLSQVRKLAGEQGTVGITDLEIGIPDDPELSPEALAEGQLVLRLRYEEQGRCLERVFGPRLQLVTNALQARKESIQNRRRFRKRQTQVELPRELDYLAHHRFNAPGLEGILGLRGAREPSRMSLIREGCLLVQLTCDRTLLGLELVVAGDFIPDNTFTDVVPDTVYGQAVNAMLECLEALYSTAAIHAGSMSKPLRRQLLAFLADALVEGFAERFLRAWGAWSHVSEPAPAQLSLGLESQSPHSLATAPLVSDVNGRWWSLLHLKQKGGLPWVSSAQPLHRNYPRLLLHLDADEKTVLDHVFPNALRYQAADYERALRQKAHRKKPEERLTCTALSPAGYQVGFECSTTRGRVAFWPREPGTRRTSTLRLLHEHRQLRTYDLDLGLPPLEAVLNDDTLQPNEEWNGLRDPADEQRCRRVVYRAALALLDHLAQILPRVPEKACAAEQWLLRRALSALVPHASFGVGLRWLLANDPSPWQTYMAIKGLTAWIPTDRLVSALDALLAARQPLSLETLWDQLSEDGSLPEPLPALKSELPTNTRFATSPPPGAPGRPLIQRLEELPLFQSLGGEHLSLADLRQRCSSGPLLYLMDNSEAWLLADHFVLHLPGPDRNDLLRFLGTDALTDARPLLEARRKAAEFESRGVATLHLLQGTTLVKTGLKTSELTGEVGLADEPGEGNWVLLHKSRRYVCRQEGVFSQALVAVVNSDALQPTDDFQGVVPDGARAQVMAACEDQLPKLLQGLQQQWSRLEDSARDAAYEHMLAYLVGPAASGQWRGEDPPSQLYRSLTELCWLPGLAEQRYSLVDLRAEQAEHGELVYLPKPLPGGTKRRVLLPADRHLGLLRRLFDPVRDFTDDWEEANLRETLGLSEATVLPPHSPDDELVGARCRGAGFEGRLFLPRSDRIPLVLRFGVSRLVVHTETLSDFAPCAGHLLASRTTYRQSGGKVHLGPHDRYNLQTACYRLYRSLARKLLSLEDPAERERARTLLLNLTLELRRRQQGQSAILEERWVRLYDTLADLPLLEWPKGGRMSLAAALERRPPALASLGLWQEVALAAPPGIAEPTPPPGDKPAATAPEPEESGLDQAFAVSTLPIPSRALQTEEPEDRAPEPEAPQAPEPEAPPAPPPEKPAARLARWLRQAFERLGQGVDLQPREAAGHLEVARHLERGLRLTTDSSGDAVRCDDRGLWLVTDHPLVSSVLERAEPDPLLLSLLLSAVYTAVNLHLERVTDDHEHAFLDALTAGVLTDLTPVETP